MKTYPIYKNGSGLLAVMPHPSGGELLQSQMAYLANCKFDTVVSLLTETEEQALGLMGEAEAIVGLGMEFLSLPIHDMGEPTDLQAFCILAGRLAADIEQTHRVLVHCYAGIGRSGLLSAAILVALGSDPENVFDVVTRARGAVVPETAEQRRWFLRELLPHLQKLER